MSNETKSPGEKVVILYENEILPVEIISVTTCADSEGTQTSCTVIDVPDEENRVLGWQGKIVPIEEVFSSEDQLTEHLKLKYREKHAK